MDGYWTGWVFALICLGCILFGVWQEAEKVGIGLSKRYKRRVARIYANWLEMAYPALTTRAAAAERFRALVAQSPYISEEVQEELLFAHLVSQGWHEDGNIAA